MRSLRSTRALRLVSAGAVLVASLFLFAGCTGVRQGSHPQGLSRQQALQLAVSLANQECQAKFSTAPFDTATSRIHFVDGRWSWGGLDLAGPAGLSADVSFDAHGDDRRVEAYLSADGLSPSLPPDSTRQRE